MHAHDAIDLVELSEEALEEEHWVEAITLDWLS